MDILDIDEVLNEDSFCLLDEKNQDDVTHILQQWKEGMRDKIPKPDTRTFTRVKHKVHNNDSSYLNNKYNFDTERRENTFDMDSPAAIPLISNFNGQIFNNHNQHQQQQFQQQNDIFLNDTSPPHSSCFMMDSISNNFNTSLVSSNDFRNIAFLNSTDCDNISKIDNFINPTTTTTAAAASSITTTIVTPTTTIINNEQKNNHNNELFDNLALSNLKDSNISQTDELSQLNAIYTNTNDDGSSISGSLTNLNDDTFINNIQPPIMLSSSLSLSQHNDNTFTKDNDKDISSFYSSSSSANDKPNDHQQQQQQQLDNTYTPAVNTTFEFDNTNSKFLLNSINNELNYLPNDSTSSSSSLSSNLTFKRSHKNSKFSDKTYKKSSKLNSSIKNNSTINIYNKNETYETDLIDKLTDLEINNDTFNNLDLINNFDLNDMHFNFKETDPLKISKLSNNSSKSSLSSSSITTAAATTTNYLPVHSTPFRPITNTTITDLIDIPIKSMNNSQQDQQSINSLTEKLNLLKKDLDYNDDDDDDDNGDGKNDKFIEKIVSEVNEDKFLSDFKEIEKEIELNLENENKHDKENLIINKNDDIDDIDVDDNDVNDVDIDEDDDDCLEFTKDYCINNIKMRQSLDNIKKRYFSEKNDIMKTNIMNCDIMQNNKKNSNYSGINNGIIITKTTTTATITNNCGNNDQRLLSRRSRLYDNIDPINLKQQIEKNDKYNNDNIKNDLEIELNNDEQHIKNDNNKINPLENKINDIDNYIRNDDQFKTMIIRKRNHNDINNIEKNLQYHQNKNHEIDNNSMITTQIQAINENSYNSKDNNKKLNNEMSPPPPPPSSSSSPSLLQKRLPQRTLTRPRYISQYFRQNPDTFQKANSAGELHKNDMKSCNLGINCGIGGSNGSNNDLTLKNSKDSTIMKNKAKSLHNLAAGLNSVNIPDNRYFKKPEIPPPSSSSMATGAQSRLGKPMKISTTQKVSNTTTNLRPVTSRSTRLLRPSSGYYSYNTKEIPDSDQESGCIPLSMNPPPPPLSSSSASSISSSNTKISCINTEKGKISSASSIDSIESYPKNGVGSISNLQQPTTINANSKIPSAKIKRSGLPRPSNVIRR